MYAAAFQELFSLPEQRPKVDSYIAKTVSSYSDEEFKRNFRITRSVAELLAAEFAKSPHCPKKRDRGGLPPKSPEEHILSFLCVYHIVGDAAYPFREHLMTPIRDYGNLDCSDRAFNARLSGTRVLIENAFGDLKNRFRQLHRLDMWTVDNMSKFIISCCVLHNLCIEQGDLPENLSRDMSLSLQTPNDNDTGPPATQQSSGSNGSQQDNLLRALAGIKRAHLMVKMGLRRPQP
ncbi:hypothetical protein HPB49_020177 [Dermacentor silvarum]|uniref:Uncharacterized protein n=1 Tax=Dermacentor silvarum TaxID=543639 RepID=A0ACB8CB72_DERSI|nr:hypothetical protein HPB49_020177 [Dermacentor silvarum]